ncbi:MAG: penicillin acylase family protein, partial [Rhodothermales bacterium]|nr:penicillin acylase family protein [Rhodothermales bacterium]
YSIVRLDSLASDATGFYPRIWFNDTYSTWASEVVPMLVEAASDSAAGPMVQDAISYLRNWDFTFDRASIAASILNVWAEIALELEGSWPSLGSDGVSEDESPPDRRRWSAFLEFAVARLATDFGSDMSMWRWERVNAGRLRFPILGDMDPGRSRFVPTVASGFGHPSAPAWGPPAVYATYKPHSVWEGWTIAGSSGGWVSRRLLPETDAAFRGTAASGYSRQTVAIDDVPRGTGQSTVLTPMP